MPIHPNYEPVEGLPLPLGDAILVRECLQDEYKTKAGIIMPGGDSLNHCKIGICMNKGELCSIPVKEGDVVAFDQMCRFGIKHKDVAYISVASHMTYFVVPNGTYLEPHTKDFFEKRREKRIAGAKTVEKREINEFDQKVEERKSGDIFPVTKDFTK